MAQFDALIIFSLLWSLLLILFLHYRLSIEILIPNFFGIKKFREKKLNSTLFYNFFVEDSKISSTYSYLKAS